MRGRGRLSPSTAGSENGTFTCADPEGTAWRILSLIDGLSTQATVRRRTLPRARLAELVRTATGTEVGLAPDTLR